MSVRRKSPDHTGAYREGSSPATSQDLIAQLDALEQRYQQWVAPLDQLMHELSYRVNRDGYTAADYDADVRAFREQQLAAYNPYIHIYTVLDQLCPTYLAMGDAQRAEIRTAVKDKSGLSSGLLGYVYQAAERLRSGQGLDWLRWGLAAISIEDCSRDARDVMLALAELYVAAEEAGIRPQPHFTAVAKLSSMQKPEGGDTPVARMLANFSSYGALRERRNRGRPRPSS